jgi:1-acyl-sn-glycerol-3-phosphate acyltransferase
LKKTIFTTPILSTILYWGCILFVKIFRWKMEGVLPDKKKFVMIAAPHTSNWDLPMMLTIAFVFNIELLWMGKESLFKFPFGGFMKWLGGIPVDRSKKSNVVDQTIDFFNQHEDIIITIPPEGTRNKVNYWKTGFYYVADGANVPIVLGFIDYKRKAGGIGTTFYTTGNIEADMDEIKKFYSTIQGKFKNKTSDLEKTD